MNCEFDTKLQAYIDEKNLYNRYKLQPSIPLEPKFSLTQQEQKFVNSKIKPLGHFSFTDSNSFNNFYDQSLLLDVSNTKHTTVNKAPSEFSNALRQRNNISTCNQHAIDNKNEVIDKYFWNTPRNSNKPIQQNYHVTPNMKFKHALYFEKPVDVKVNANTQNIEDNLTKTYHTPVDNLDCHNKSHNKSINMTTNIFNNISQGGVYDNNTTCEQNNPINENSRFNINKNKQQKKQSIHFVSPSLTNEGVARLMSDENLQNNYDDKDGLISSFSEQKYNKTENYKEKDYKVGSVINPWHDQTNQRLAWGDVHNSKAKSHGYRNPFEHYFDYIDPELQHPDHVVLPIPRGGKLASIRKDHTCRFNETEYINKILNENTNM